MIYRAYGFNFIILYANTCCCMLCKVANSVYSDQKPLSSVSDLGLYFYQDLSGGL